MKLRSVIANNIRQRRIELGITQPELARLLGKTQPYISQLETGARSTPVGTLETLSKHLQTTPDELVKK